MIYRIVADGVDIYGDDAETTLLSPSLETELNTAGSLEFTLPPDHPAYNDIYVLKTFIEAYEDSELIFFGRVAEVSTDWFNQKRVICEGALAYMNDTVIRPSTYDDVMISSVFADMIAQHNAQVDEDRKFYIGTIDITDRNVVTDVDYGNTLSTLISTCIDSTGGYLFVRHENNKNYIDWLKEMPYGSDQPVQFAYNLLDYNSNLTSDDICTVVLPLGTDSEGNKVTIESVNGGKDTLESEAGVELYGRVLKIHEWNDISDPQTLKDAAASWLTDEQYDKLTIEVNAAEMHFLDNAVGSYKMGQLITVISEPHGINKELPIIKLSTELDSGVKKVTIGTPPRKELTTLTISNNKKQSKK